MTDSYQNKAIRCLLAQSGTWTSKDPLGFGGCSINLSMYVGNKPLSRVDSYGLVWSRAAAGVGFAGGAIGGFFYGLGTQAVMSMKCGGDFSWAAVGRATAGGSAVAGFAGGAVEGVLTPVEAPKPGGHPQPSNPTP